MTDFGPHKYDDPRFVSFGEPVTEVMGIPLSSELLQKLGSYGITFVKSSDDLQTAAPGFAMGVKGNSPIGRILSSALPADGEEDQFISTLHRVVDDISHDQFEANWPEFL